jgi:hypothetical protein
VIADYLIEPGKKNGTAIRVALIRQTHKHHISPTGGNVAGNVAQRGAAGR